MQGPPRAKHTQRRHDWLRLLADNPGTNRSGQGSCAYSCMMLGWTRWEDPSTCRGEVLTDDGLATLASWDAAAALAPPRATLREGLQSRRHNRPRNLAKRKSTRPDRLLLDSLEAHGWTVRCGSSLWEVAQGFGGNVERVLGRGRTVRMAIHAAITAQAAEPPTLGEAVVEAVLAGDPMPSAELAQEVGATWNPTLAAHLGTRMVPA